MSESNTEKYEVGVTLTRAVYIEAESAEEAAREAKNVAVDGSSIWTVKDRTVSRVKRDGEWVPINEDN